MAVSCVALLEVSGEAGGSARGSQASPSAPLRAQLETLLPLVASRACSAPSRGGSASRCSVREDTAGLCTPWPTHSGNPSLGQGCGSGPAADARTATAGPLPAQFKYI